jgi:hypothetical protein
MNWYPPPSDRWLMVNPICYREAFVRLARERSSNRSIIRVERMDGYRMIRCWQRPVTRIGSLNSDGVVYEPEGLPFLFAKRVVHEEAVPVLHVCFLTTTPSKGTTILGKSTTIIFLTEE